ncbi:MAG: NnrU family protein [Sphingomicrobium sp.]
MTVLEVAAATFVGTHFVMSHPLRRPMVKALGEKSFMGVYSLVSLASLVWMVFAARAIGPETLRWDAEQGGIVIASILMWIGTILFVGSHRGNPAFPHLGGKPQFPAEPRGVFRITRHPMMWAFGLWAIVHAIVNSTPSGLVISEAIFVLAIFGAALQDSKKRRLIGSPWKQWERKSPFFPFTRGHFWPGSIAFVVGTLLFLGATWAHGALGYRPAGLWALLGK